MSAVTRTARRGRLSATALAFAVAVLWAGPAQAGTPIQLGQLSQGDPGTCGIVTNLVQAAVAGPPSYTVPSDGVITSWSHRGNDIAPGTGRLQLWRPAGGTNYTLVGRSEIEAFVAGVVDTFATDIPVSTGDVLGFRSDTAGTGCSGAGGVGDVVRFDGANTSDPPPGVMRDMSSPSDGIRLNVSATFEPAGGGSPGSVSAKKTQKQTGKEIVVKVKVKAKEQLTANASGKVKVKKKTYKLKPKTKSVGSGKSEKLKLKLKKKDAKKIAKALKQGKKATAKLTVKLSDEAGNTKTEKLKVKLKR
jgi:hypothetical protein